MIYFPANGVPKIPTASSVQTKRNIIKRAAQIMNLCILFLTFLITNSSDSAIPSNKAPAITKSDSFQFTSAVNCIAISGISNRITTDRTITISLLFFTIIRFYRSKQFNAYILIEHCNHLIIIWHLYYVQTKDHSTFQKPIARSKTK